MNNFNLIHLFKKNISSLYDLKIIFIFPIVIFNSLKNKHCDKFIYIQIHYIFIEHQTLIIKITILFINKKVKK